MTDAAQIMASALYAAFVGPDLAARLPLPNNPVAVQRRWLALAHVAMKVAPTLRADGEYAVRQS